MIHVTMVSAYMAIVNLCSQYGVIMTKVLLFHILLLENWEIKDPFMLLHRKLPRLALGRIPVLAATLLAISVILRMPQTYPCCTRHPWEQELSHKSLEQAMAPFSSCPSSLPICLILLDLLLNLQHPHWSHCAKMQVEMITSEHREGQKKDPETPCRSRGGEKWRHWIMDYDYHGQFGNLQEDRQSCWHQNCTGLSVMYQRNHCVSGVHGFWSYHHTSYIFLQVWVDQQWLNWISRCWRVSLRAYLSFILSGTVLVSGCLSWRNRAMITLCGWQFLLNFPKLCCFLQSPQMWNGGWVSCQVQIRTLSYLLLPVCRATWCGNSVLLEITTQERTTQKACGRKILNRQAQGWDGCGTARAVMPMGS